MRYRFIGSVSDGYRVRDLPMRRLSLLAQTIVALTAQAVDYQMEQDIIYGTDRHRDGTEQG